MSTLECPYCDAEVEEPDECYQEDKVYEATCDKCDKAFVFTFSYSKHYQSDEAPCLNGEPHLWVARCGCPEFAFVGRYRCKWCDCDHVDKEERRRELQRIYDSTPEGHFDKPMLAKWLGLEVPENHKTDDTKGG